jgi:ubiquinone/menaquinone biosynthesis C-methylase UbiE
MGAQTHRSDPHTLNRRTLESDHRVLAGLLRPGMFVLDVGCGTGAITAGIARAVAPGGCVLGVDRDEALLAIAREQHPEPRFEHADALELAFDGAFDIVTAARVVQWMADPVRAIERMAAAVKPGGLLVVLDYNHLRNSWSPEPPPELKRFYAAFLDWRTSNGWVNDIAERLPEMFAAAGLTGIESVNSDETDTPDVWGGVIEGIGRQFYQDEERAVASRVYHDFLAANPVRQTLSLRTVIGRKAE